MQIASANTPAESEAMVAIAVFAALSDSGKSDPERACIADLAAELGFSDSSALARQVLAGRVTLEAAIAALTGKHQRQLAYEMALAVCEVSGSVGPEEREFLDHLKVRLGLEAVESDAVEAEVRDVIASIESAPDSASGALAAPVPPAATGPDNSGMILRYAILNAALELLPESVATMAVVPLQVKMVYRVGKSHGVSLDSGHIREFLAVAGIGMGSQMLEGFARKFLGSLGKSVAGKTGRRIASQSAGSAMAFASTYAIGILADRYYGGGRKLDTQSLRSFYEPLREKALRMHETYLPEIRERSKNLDVASVMSLVRGNQQP